MEEDTDRRREVTGPHHQCHEADMVKLEALGSQEVAIEVVRRLLDSMVGVEEAMAHLRPVCAGLRLLGCSVHLLQTTETIHTLAQQQYL